MRPQEILADAEARGYRFRRKPGGIINVVSPGGAPLPESLRQAIRLAKPRLLELLAVRDTDISVRITPEDEEFALAQAANANQLPIFSSPVRIASGRLIGDPNVAVRGILERMGCLTAGGRLSKELRALDQADWAWLLTWWRERKKKEIR